MIGSIPAFETIRAESATSLKYATFLPDVQEVITRIKKKESNK
jgi:hypothetical protein